MSNAASLRELANFYSFDSVLGKMGNLVKIGYIQMSDPIVPFENYRILERGVFPLSENI